MTKQKLQDLWDNNLSKSWEETAENLTSEFGVEINVKMAQELFRVNGFNLRARGRKPKDNWFTVIDDSTIPTSHLHDISWSTPTSVIEESLTEEVA